MSSVSICSETALLTGSGWRPARCMPSDCAIVAIDRHGQAVLANVQLSFAQDIARPAFLGTASAFGLFDAETRIVTSEGRRIPVRALVEGNDLSSTFFEVVVRLPEVVNAEPKPDELWHYLQVASAVSDSRCIALRCREPDITAEWIRKEKCGNQTYLVIDKDRFEKSLQLDWSQAIVNLSTNWLASPDSDYLEFERSHHHLAMWLTTAYLAAGKRFEFRFDLLQHSSYLAIKTVPEPPSPLQRGGCAFFSPDEDRILTLSWSDTSLSPIAGGFLVAP